MKSISTHLRILSAIALLASTIAIWSMSARAQEDEQGETPALVASGVEVRIGAQRHDDGRTEFALQVQEDDGWSELVLPRSRFFPATARVDRWLNSSVLELESAHTVRISARLLDNGRIEFALQQRIGEAWADRLLPRPRFFPENATVDRWLYSGRVEPVGYVPFQGRAASVGAVTTFSNWFESLTGGDYDSYQSGADVGAPIEGHGTTASGGDVIFLVSCNTADNDKGTLRISVTALQRLSGARRTISLTQQLGDNDPTTEEWNVGGDVRNQFGVSLSAPDPETLYEQLHSVSTIRFQIAGHPDVDVTFDISDLYNTGIQDNLDQCGNYLPQPWPDRFPE